MLVGLFHTKQAVVFVHRVIADFINEYTLYCCVTTLLKMLLQGTQYMDDLENYYERIYFSLFRREERI